MVQFKRNLLSVALASATMMLAAGAQAQTAEEQTTQEQQQAESAKQAKTLDTVTVTGIRRGIENAIETKKDSANIVESISAEDIGKLPDVSIAESIARLPGLTAQRVAGRASTIQIRGLADDFGTALLNGREQVSVGHNRGVEFDQYPSEMMNAVVVHKTPQASLVGQGLSGTVDLQTVRPLAFPERVISFNVRGEKNSLGELNPGYDDMGFRASGSYIDQFLDNTLGIAIGYAHLDSPGQANRWEAWGYPTVGGNFLLGGSKSLASSTENKRDGLMGIVQYKPNDRYESILDLYYSKFEKAETTRFMETGLGWSGAVLSNPVIEGNSIVGGTFTGVRPVLRNDRNTQDDKIFAAGWNHKFKFSDDWSAEADVSYSKAERKEMLLETYAGLGPSTDPLATDTVNFTIDRGTGLPNFTYGRDYTDPNAIVLTDPGGWGQEGFVKFPSVEDELTSFRLSAERSFEEGIFSSFEFGVNHADREKTRSSGLEAFLCLGPNPDGGGCRDAAGNLTGATATIPSSALNNPVDLSFTGIPGSISYDTDAIFGMYTVSPLVHRDVTNKNWTVNEKLTTFYTQWNIDANLSDSVSLRGNVGFQYVRTDQSSNGFDVPFDQADAALPASGGAEYGDFLPSLNLVFGLPADQKIRFGLAEQMARPRMDYLRANSNVGIDMSRGGPNGLWTKNGGNPELEPWRATALDLSYEKYFGGKGYFSIAAFNKDLHTWVRNETVPYDFSGYDSGDAVRPDSDIGEYTRPANRNGGKIYGFEASVSVPFELLWQPLDGFGLIASYSDTHSAVRPDGPGTPTVPVEGLSTEVSNITLYYEKHGFSTRVSQRHRSPFLGEVTGFGADRSARWINTEDIVDFQVGYSFAEGSSLEGLSLLLQVNNVTNEPYREFFPEFENLPRMYNEYGRTVLLGATYKF